jgi:hypothetical protein
MKKGSMKSLPKDEMLRLDALQEYGVSDPDSPAALDPALLELTTLAAELCSTSMAGISLVGADSVLHIARAGGGPARVQRGNTPAESTMCGTKPAYNRIVRQPALTSSARTPPPLCARRPAFASVACTCRIPLRIPSL